MTAINIKALQGSIPRTDTRLSAGNVAAEALNCRLTSGRLDPLKGALPVFEADIDRVATLFRYRHEEIDYWLTWARTVDVRRATTAQDAYNRLFWTGDGEPRMGGSADVLTGSGPYPGACFVLGVYIPILAPTLASVTGGAAANEDRSYVYTFVTAYGEESAPSPAVTFTGKSDGTWHLTAMEAAPPNSGTISAATASAGIVTVTLNTVVGLAVYEEIDIAGVVGMTDLNGRHAILSVDTATNKVTVALTTAQAYVAGADTWARAAPHHTTGMKRRIYRTVGTNTDYKFVAEIAAATLLYDDSIAATAVTRAITTLDSYTPPKNGHSLCSLANGSHAMLAGNELCISRQYAPYDYPLTNRYAFDGTPVAMVSAGNSLIILRSDGKPRVYTANDPSAASGADIPTTAPCVNKRGVVDANGYALYPSTDGLYAVSPSDARNLTEKLYRFTEWRTLNPSTFIAAIHDQTYYAMHDSDDGNPGRIVVLDIAELERGVREVVDQVSAIYRNPHDGELYVVKDGNSVCQWDADDANRYLASWTSVDFQFGTPINFTAAQVHAQYDEIIAPNTAIADANALILADINLLRGELGAGTPVGLYPLGATNLSHVPDVTQNRVQFSLLRDGTVIYSRDVTSSKPFRVPAGKRGEVFSVQISASVPVHSVTVAQSMHELGRTSE